MCIRDRVIGVPDEIEGETVFAYVALQPGASATPEELIQFTLDRLNETWAPAAVGFIDELPLTEFGKVDKKVLRQRYHETRSPAAADH